MSYKPGLLGNIVIKGTICAKTGLHIGASNDTVEIGGIDSPVIKHPITGAPYIPGSSLKGKMRSIMEKIALAMCPTKIVYNRNSGSEKNHIMQHVCDDIDSFEYDNSKFEHNKQPIQGPGAKNCKICRVYGSTGQSKNNSNKKRNFPAKILVRDCNLTEKGEQLLKPDNIFVFEAKMENAIDRVTAAAQPRTFERVPAGAEFGFEIVYKVQIDYENVQIFEQEIDNVIIDIKNIFLVLSIIQHDGLGGSISRGYGRVEFLIDKKTSKYYKVSYTSDEFLPNVYNNLDTLRQDGFEKLKALLNKNVSQ